KLNIDKIQSCYFRPFVDSTTYRFHSTITSLRSEFRNFITYDKREIVSLDLKNSQPFISTVILKPEFWTNDSSITNIFDITSNKVRNYFIKTLYLSNTLMWEKIDTIQYQQGFDRYTKIVQN